MRTNTRREATPVFTHNGAKATPTSPLNQLRRSVLACLLWEREFYESGQSIVDRIADLIKRIPAYQVAELALEARTAHHLRHVPLLLLRELAREPLSRKLVGAYLPQVIQRADECAEFLSLYWKPKKQPLAKQVRKGLAAAFAKFDAYALGKYNRAGAEITLRDVMFLTHPKPATAEQAEVWAKLANGALEAPDTWEVALSGGANKRATFERLITEGKLGYFALLRNLRGMTEAGVDRDLMRQAVLARRGGADKVLPFRFIAAARACPWIEADLDRAMMASIELLPRLSGSTAVLVDVSGSMDLTLSAKSDLTRLDAAAALASIVRAEQLRVFTFSNRLAEVPPRRGMAGVDAVRNSQPHGNTDLAGALRTLKTLPCDRLIVITDEQVDSSAIRHAFGNAWPRGYMINVASARNGISYGNGWKHVDGFSEQVLHWIAAVEADEAVKVDEERW